MQYGIVYKTSWLYDAFMRMLYGKGLEEILNAVVKEIPSGCRVLDLCCGTGRLGMRLRGHAAYTGIDINERFVKSMVDKSINAICADVAKVNLPKADIVVMLLSMYHFGLDAPIMLERMLSCASQKVILVEPVQNYAASESKWIAAFAARITAVNGTQQDYRFTSENFRDLVVRDGHDVRLEALTSGHDLMAIISTESRSCMAGRV